MTDLIQVYISPKLVVRLQQAPADIITVESGHPGYQHTGVLALATYVFEGNGLWVFENAYVVEPLDGDIHKAYMGYDLVRPMGFFEAMRHYRGSKDILDQSRLCRLWNQQ